MKITIDQEKCIDCGSCAAICPNFFEMDENNKAQVKEEKTKADDKCVQEAVDICPVQAIEIDKNQG